jgi:hydrogenase maturation protease
MKTIILGLGNSLFGDDAVGVLVARALKPRAANADIIIEEAAVAGLDVLDLLSGSDRAIIIDAVQTPQGRPGSIYRLDRTQISRFESPNPHQLDFLAALELGQRLGLELPREIILFGIEAGNIIEPNQVCTKEVEAAIPGCLAAIVRELETGLMAVKT